VNRWTNLAIATAAASSLESIESGLRCLLLLLSVGGLVWTWIHPRKPPTCPLAPKPTPQDGPSGKAAKLANN